MCAAACECVLQCVNICRLLGVAMWEICVAVRGMGVAARVQFVECVLHRVNVCCSMWMCVVVCEYVLQCANVRRFLRVQSKKRHPFNFKSRFAHCNTLQHTATHCNNTQCTANTCCSVRMCVAMILLRVLFKKRHLFKFKFRFTHCNTLQQHMIQHNARKGTHSHTVTNCNTHIGAAALIHTLQHTFTHCNTHSNTATNIYTLQHTLTHCNTHPCSATQTR